MTAMVMRTRVRSKYSFKLLSRPFSRKTALHTLTGEAFQQDRQSLLFMRCAGALRGRGC